ncbi:MAG TPA: DUF3971 domain-containing protein, partial [Caldimonas sp.]|nr:DUF3971 domain-containing protein [Caldimonas sp.]
MSPRSPNARAATKHRKPPRSRRRPFRLAARILLGLVGTAWAILFVGWLSLHWLILPHIEQWRAPIEARASRMLGAPVRIGAIEVRSSGWVPSIDLRDVRILDAQQRVALSLAHVTAAFSTHSLLVLEPRFEQLLIESPTLDVRRDAAGHIRVAGFDFGSSKMSADDGGAAADWFFKQHEFVIRNGTVRWIDEARQAPPLVLSGVDIVVRNGLRSHAMRIDATPPVEWGDRFRVRGRFEQPLFARAGDWRRWQGTVYAELPRADVRELRQHVELPFELSEGDGALRGWFDISQGRPRAATVDVSLRAVTLRLDKTVEPLQFAQIEGRIGARKSGERTSVDVHGFGFVTGDGIRWPRGDLDVSWHQTEGGDVDGGDFAADRLDLGVMAGIASRVPLGAALRNLLADLHPQGIITGLKTRWDGPLDAPVHYHVAGNLSGLSLSAHAAATADAIGRPGLSNATIGLVADETGGQARIAVKDGILDVPGVFADPALPLARLDSHLTWTIDPGRSAGEAPRITVKVDSAQFANADAQGDLTATWRTGAGSSSGMAHGDRYPGRLDLEGRLTNAQAIRTVRYLPLGLPDSVRDYVGRAVRGGTIPSATFRVRGDLADFPFHGARSAGDSEFHIAAKVDNLTFDYVPDRRTGSGRGSKDPAAATTGVDAAGRSAPRVAGATTASSRAGGRAATPAAGADAVLPADLAASAAAPGIAVAGTSAPGGRTETWPPLTALTGELVIDRSTLEVKNAR